ncbi:MAG: dephospho-CoA kinase [Deltaproteobacteria bacterium]|nr:dephospho-CoA kinase [Candidatus Anaeroferrophillacea bacterium]
MKCTRDWEPVVRGLERLLRLRSFPVAFRMLEKKAALDEIPFLRRLSSPRTLCQLINLARNFDWTVGAVAGDFLSPSCSSIIGLTDLPPAYADGTFRTIVWVADREQGKKFEAAIPRLPRGKYEAVALAPLVYNPFEPDIVLIYGNPAQVMMLVNALQFRNYEVMQFACVGESSCADAIVRGYESGRPAVAIPCYGERCYGHAQDDEMVIAVPAARLPEALEGLQALYRRGVRYPISFSGAATDLEHEFPPAYKSLDTMMARVRGDGRRLMVGLTGGIASGKSTVVAGLRGKGAPVIDFDLIARRVVAPGTPGLAAIVDYFGRQVLADDGSLDRKKLSDIVFGDMEKRKKLEGITHPAIYEEFFRQTEEICRERDWPIIIVDIPLLIELNLQYLFDRLIVVHVPREVQVERLAKRDGISREAAAKMLAAQLSIDDKIPFAQEVIDNRGTPAATAVRVDEVWARLERLRRERMTASWKAGAGRQNSGDRSREPASHAVRGSD